MTRKKIDQSSWFDYNVDIEKRLIYMGSDNDTDGDENGVDYKMAESTIKALISLDSMAPDGDKPITIIMNNPGGDEYHGLAIYDAIKSCRNHITILVFGMAMSMGAWILQAADKRVLAPNSRVMIHYGSFGATDHAMTVYKWVEENKKLDKLMEDVFLEKIHQKDSSFSRLRLQKMLSFDTILSASEAVALGLADEILGEQTE